MESKLEFTLLIRFIEFELDDHSPSFRTSSFLIAGWFLASIFVLYNLVGQLGAAGMVLTKKHVPIACGILFSIVILQVTI